jgi:pyroglutamyl-peptidase
MIRILVTGFGPFPRVPRNPSGALAQRVAALAAAEGLEVVPGRYDPSVGEVAVRVSLAAPSGSGAPGGAP